MTYQQPWIRNAPYDSVFVLLVPFLALGVVCFLPASFKHTSEMPVIGWCVLILLVDVAHVYSTLYNTYFDKERFARHKSLFLLVPMLCYVAGALLYFMGGMVFWHALAYLAVFHFIRQQYGFMRMYARHEPKNQLPALIDTIAIYTATLYPLIYWHCTPGRNFNWFVNGDFFLANAANIKWAAYFGYLAVIILYVIKEALSFIKTGRTNIPKNALVLGTFVSWYYGIVYFNGDMAFTLLNVVSHGIPYMALVWYGINKQTPQPARKPKQPNVLAKQWYGLLLFLGSLFLLAYLEEGLWDGFIWHDHPALFSMFNHLPHIYNHIILAFLVPMLSLPQSTHYVLDGFIWRRGYG